MFKRPAPVPILVREDVDAVHAALMDIRREVAEIRIFLDDDDGEERSDP
jgi:hypothetical protein